MNQDEFEESFAQLALMDGSNPKYEALEMGRLVKEADYRIAEVKKTIEELTLKLKARLDILGKQRAELITEIEKRFPVMEKKWSDDVINLSWRESESVEVDDQSLLPSDCVRIKTEPDKIQIRKYLKAGKQVQGAYLKTNYSLQIK